MRGEWIEIVRTAAKVSPSRSLPMRGEWIEIATFGGSFPAAMRLSPCGESGLKWGSDSALPASNRSLPMRGEWIEISSAASISTSR